MIKEYEPETLSRLHAIELEIMKEVIRICRQNNIEYFLICGTLLGAVRHKGFIPWDDDVDIGMTRENYDKFMSVLPEQLGEEFYYIDCNISSIYPFIAPRIMKKGTIFKEEIFKGVNMDIPLGVFVDIWPFDNIPDNAFLRKKQALEASFLVKLLMLRYIKFPTLQFGGFLAKIAHAACFMVYAMLKVFRIPRRVLLNRIQKVITRYDNMETQMVSTLIDTDPLAGRLSKSDLYPLRTIEFEGIPMLTVNNTHQLLANTYGDYMQIPPKEKRKMHKPYILDLGNT